MSSVDVLRPNQMNELRIQMKRWERQFEQTNGRKPKTDDVDNDEQIKQIYIIYGKLKKQLKKQEADNLRTAPEQPTENQEKTKPDPSQDVWNDSCRKPVNNRSVEERQRTAVCNKTKLMSNSLLKNRLQSKSPRKSHSLKRKKPGADGKKQMMMHGMQFDLFVKPIAEVPGQSAETANDNEMVNLFKNGQHVAQILDYSEDGPRFDIEPPSPPPAVSNPINSNDDSNHPNNSNHLDNHPWKQNHPDDHPNNQNHPDDNPNNQNHPLQFDYPDHDEPSVLHEIPMNQQQQFHDGAYQAPHSFDRPAYPSTSTAPQMTHQVYSSNQSTYQETSQQFPSNNPMNQQFTSNPTNQQFTSNNPMNQQFTSNNSTSQQFTSNPMDPQFSSNHPPQYSYQSHQESSVHHETPANHQQQPYHQQNDVFQTPQFHSFDQPAYPSTVPPMTHHQTFTSNQPQSGYQDNSQQFTANNQTNQINTNQQTGHLLNPNQQTYQPFNGQSNQLYNPTSHLPQQQFAQDDHDEIDFGSLISSSIENLNSERRERVFGFNDQGNGYLNSGFNSNLNDNLNSNLTSHLNSNWNSNLNSHQDDLPTASNYQHFTELTASSSNFSTENTNSSDFSPPKGIPPEQLSFANMIDFSKGFENPLGAHCSFTNLHDDGDDDVDDVYDFDKYLPKAETPPEATTSKKATKKATTKKATTKKATTKKTTKKTSEATDESAEKSNEKTIAAKLGVKELTKNKAKKRKTSQKDMNFVRIDVNKRKRYVKGHKKFNMKNYKSKEWKKLKEAAGNSCFKCGAEDHWARDCPKGDAELREIEQDGDYDELEDMAGGQSSDQLIVSSAQPLFNENELYSMQVEIRAALEQFGFESFRANQREVCERILMGRSTLMISSTGSGKSLCYQLPAYIYYKLRKYVTIVVTPLISLMEDQIRCMPKCLRAVCLHSGLTETVKKSNLAKIQSGEAQVLFLSPEYIMAHLIELSLLPTIGFVCIDEAHCLSEWSNNFRPSYLQFFQMLKERVKINTFLALTATANRATARQVLKNIGLSLEQDVIGMTRIPSNLALTISRDSDKDFALISLLKSERFRDLKSIIIYCSRRETTEKIATLLRIELQKSKDPSIDQEWTAAAYHAGLSYQEKVRIQKNFISGALRVVVATLAFGMGINKSDVDGIIHFSLPKTIENYVQEIGRAGRNGRTAQCHLFLDHDASDLFEQQKHIYSNGMDKISVKKLTAKLFKPCKCLKLRQLAEEEQRMNGQSSGQSGGHSNDQSNGQSSVQSNDRSNRCPGHENSFTVKELTEELDIKEETLLTILIYLELNLKRFNIKVMNKTNSTCILSCYKGGSKQLEQLAKQHAFVGLPLAQLKKDQPNLEGQTIIRFSYINVASMLGQSSREVLRKLKALAWKYEGNRRIRSDVRLAFDDPSFHVITPGDLNETETEEIMQMILNYSKSQEVLEVKRLKQFYETLKECSQSRCTNKVNTSKSLKLKKILNDYYDLSRPQSSLPEEDDLEEVENLQRIAGQSVILKTSNNSEIEEARRDIRDLINIHSEQFLTARAITRILQGITSPKYSAEVWGRDKRFWRKRIKMDFNLLLRLANEELVRIKCSA